MDTATGRLTLVSVTQGETNPSFIALDPMRRYLYAVNEIGNYQNRQSGSVAAFAIDASTGGLTFLNRQPTEGRTSAHVSVDPTNRFVMVANYTGTAQGNVGVLPILADGTLGEPSDVVNHMGETGPNRGPQTQPRAHMILPDASGRFVLVNDLGLDKTIIYALDRENGRLNPAQQPFAQAAPGAGPRHLAFHPNGRVVYVINELNSTMSVFSYDPERGAMEHRQTQTTLPSFYAGSNSTAHVVVAPSGRFVYGSNRGHNSIVIFAVDPASGELTLVGHQLTQGETPRNFAIDPSGNFLFVGHQNTDSIVTFKVDQETGRLSPADQFFLRQPQPVCFVFAPPQPSGNTANAGVTFWANPDPYPVMDSIPWGETTLAWNAPGATEVDIRVGSVDGPSMGVQPRDGTVETGRWVRNGMMFFLQDVSGGRPLTAQNTLATLRVGLRQAGCLWPKSIETWWN
jgi:6-phosphogluconolactonase